MGDGAELRQKPRVGRLGRWVARQIGRKRLTLGDRLQRKENTQKEDSIEMKRQIMNASCRFRVNIPNKKNKTKHGVREKYEPQRQVRFAAPTERFADQTMRPGHRR